MNKVMRFAPVLLLVALLAASFGQGPLPLGSYTLGLDVDPLFVASITLGAPVFYQYGGILSFAGIASSSISVPKLPALAGTRLYHAAVTYTTSIRGAPTPWVR